MRKSGRSGGPSPTARTIPSFGGTSCVPCGTSRPDLRIRSGSSSLITTWSKRGRRTSGTGAHSTGARGAGRSRRAGRRRSSPGRGGRTRGGPARRDAEADRVADGVAHDRAAVAVGGELVGVVPERVGTADLDVDEAVR